MCAHFPHAIDVTPVRHSPACFYLFWDNTGAADEDGDGEGVDSRHLSISLCLSLVAIYEAAAACIKAPGAAAPERVEVGLF